MGRRIAGQVPASPNLAARVRELLTAGLSKRAIAIRLGVSETTVYRCLRGEAGGKKPEAGAGGGTGSDSRMRRAKLLKGTALGADNEEGSEDDDGYPPTLLKRVPRDYVPVLPRGHYLALTAAAGRVHSAAAAESLRQALLLHAEPMIPPPTSIELMLSEAEEAELGIRGAAGVSLDRDFTIG